MNGFAALESLLTVPAEPTVEEVLSLFLGRSLDEVSDWPAHPDTMIDGLDRNACHDAVFDRAMRLCGGDALLAACVAEMISTIVPLATSLDEVDAAIDMTAQWMTALQTDHLLTRIVDAKCEAEEDGLHERNVADLTDDDRRILAERLQELDELEADGTLVISLGGLDAMFTVETGCILVVVQTAPASDEFLVLYSFEHVGQDEDDWGGDDGGDPEPDPIPEDGPRTLVAA